ncbi:hypothetical protein [Kribbella sp. NBC_00889]|uniref:hypothetical protein n=1 Tax=Kribbella sp. NBC_00889 TaxID=2975974 RepID=UPI003865C3D5|nr:DUF2325 domain-containing protein [Kribbella sp. NBC_00889]
MGNDVRILLDPDLLIPPNKGAARADYLAYWECVLDWADDLRVVIGEATFSHAYDYYARFGYPQNELEYIYDKPVRHEYRRALDHLLSRVAHHVATPGKRSMDPEYQRGQRISKVLEWDASGTSGGDVVAIGSHFENWATASLDVTFDPPPPNSLALCFEPNMELSIEVETEIHEFFIGRKLHIVGGKPDERVLAEIIEATGLESSSIQWIPSEKNKPPRKLADQWSGLKAGRDITVCITGRIGHAQSAVAERAAAKCGVPHIQAERASEISARLCQLASSK